MIFEPKVFNFTHGTIKEYSALNNISRSEYLSYTHGYQRALQDMMHLVKSQIRESREYSEILIEVTNSINASLEQQLTA